MQVLYPWGLGLVKISILTFYRRLFPDEQFRKCCLVMIGFCTALMVSISIAQALACTPVAAGFTYDMAGHCVDRVALQYTGSAINLSTDLMILLMPVKYLWGIDPFINAYRQAITDSSHFLALSLERHLRLGIIVLFSMGLTSVHAPCSIIFEY